MYASNVDINQNVEMTKLMDEILIVTMEMKDSFPEVYKHLDETPLFNLTDEKELNSNDFEEYLDTIQSQLKKMSTF